MIRQHFYPKNNIRKRKQHSRRCLDNSENEPSCSLLDRHTLSNPKFLLIDPELTQLSQPEPSHKSYHKKACSAIKPMQSAILHNRNKSSRQGEGKNFLLQSRRKQICNPTAYNNRCFSTAKREKSQPLDTLCENKQPLNLILPKGRTRQNRKKEKIPMSMRQKFSYGYEKKAFEPKVRGWQTYADDFVDFM